jgi:ribosomal protein L11 methylase PrmA
MMNAIADPGSFRDPAGRVFAIDGRIFRTVMPVSAPAYESARGSGILARLADREMIVGFEETDRKPLGTLADASTYVLEHPRIPFISYPYEWSFSLHKRAALHHLDVHLEALESGFTLSDATAYNIQFVGTRPVFIDHLSFRPYREGELWIGHRQFCMQFLNPLIVWALLGIQPNYWFRGSLEGVAPEDLAPLLSWRHNLSWTVMTHVTAQAALQRRSIKNGATVQPRERRLSPTAFKAILAGLRSYIARLEPKRKATVWGDYAGDNSYADGEAAQKRRFICEMTEATRPRLLLDLGCNSGDYSQAALDAGAESVIGFDFDHGALERAFQRFDAARAPVLPLWLDAANPSPSQGWAQAERKGLAERAQADAMIALAFIHHIAIGRNIPLDMALDWLIAMAPVGVIEFPPKSDPMVQKLLSQREDIFPDYEEASFVSLIEQRARIVRSEHLSEGGRLLVCYDRS